MRIKSEKTKSSSLICRALIRKFFEFREKSGENLLLLFMSKGDCSNFLRERQFEEKNVACKKSIDY